MPSSCLLQLDRDVISNPPPPQGGSAAILRLNNRLSRRCGTIEREWQANQAGAKRRNVQDNHDKGEEVHAHRNGDPDMHGEHTGEAEQTCSLWPDEKNIAGFENADKNPGEREEVSPEDQSIWRDHVKRRARQSAPHTRTVPPATA